jgi:hypothetical protein
MWRKSNESDRKIYTNIELLYYGGTKLLLTQGGYYGAAHKSTPVTMNGEKGFLIWDYIVFNELTFLNHNTGKIVSLYTSFSDESVKYIV